MNSCVYPFRRKLRMLFFFPIISIPLPQVGFDLVNIQPPASYLDPSVSKRVKWVHGNLYVDPVQWWDLMFWFTDLGVPYFPV